VLVVGGGAAGYFFAINAAEANRSLTVAILEKQQAPLAKVRVSGGGRCNVTNACADPRELISFYPRGGKELLPLFHRFNTTHTVAWFAGRGIKLKTERDGRIFPLSNSSQTIIDCFSHEAERLGIKVFLKTEIKQLMQHSTGWRIETNREEEFTGKFIFMGAGASQSIWSVLKGLGHRIVAPVPSLFSFQSKSPVLNGLSGVAVPDVRLSACGASTSGPLLITHTGISGPVVLRLSAWAARELADCTYRFTCTVNFTGCKNDEQAAQLLEKIKQENAFRVVLTHQLFGIPSRLWERLVAQAGIAADKKWHMLSKAKLRELARLLFALQLVVDGKSTNKEEFVTSGGVDRKEIDWKRMESKILPGLFLGGEIIDIDAVTGGFNFQAAWTTAFIAAQAAASPRG
jgi:hypothetical protein